MRISTIVLDGSDFVATKAMGILEISIQASGGACSVFGDYPLTEYGFPPAALTLEDGESVTYQSNGQGPITGLTVSGNAQITMAFP